jgi:hypothetical protein
MNKPTNLQDVVWVLVMHGDGWWWPLVVHHKHTLVHFFGQGQHSLVVLRTAHDPLLQEASRAHPELSLSNGGWWRDRDRRGRGCLSSTSSVADGVCYCYIHHRSE